MIRVAWVLGALLLYLATGIFIVRGNEQALVRRFGKARLPMATSGLHFDLPWPFTQIDRLNIHEVRTISIGVLTLEPLEATGFLRELNVDRQGEFLTGDKNILNLAVNVQYRISNPYAWLCLGANPEAGLKLLTESIVTDTVSRSGVDYVHPLGLNELRVLLTRQAREAAERQPWGVVVDDVTIAGAFPPVEVKAAFLDVSNARAEKERTINQEEAQAEKRVAAARAVAAREIDRAETEKNTRVETARGAADRFLAVIAEFKRNAGSPDDANAVRRQTMQRLYAAAMEQWLPRLAGKVLIDPHDTVDLTIFPPADPGPAKKTD